MANSVDTDSKFTIWQHNEYLTSIAPTRIRVEFRCPNRIQQFYDNAGRQKTPIYDRNLSKPARGRIFHGHRFLFRFVVVVFSLLGRGVGGGDRNKIRVASRKGLR